ncbi:Lipase_class 3 family protein [Hexamita inflata]|uniref:sn-1-specific diacylglycerol lipase n=1 Tax=Hexamita inflata TaxID=28002 RepID=A0AA86V7Z8_9EUKA|nr:Lipase class 3 family protein [Hexamita inflata]
MQKCPFDVKAAFQKMFKDTGISLFDIIKYQKQVTKRVPAFGKLVTPSADLKTYATLACCFMTYRFANVMMKPMSFARLIQAAMIDKYDFKSNYLSMTTKRSIIDYLNRTKHVGYSVDNMVMCNLSQSDKKLYQPFFFVFRNPDTGSLIISLRGTTTMMDTMTDLDARTQQVSHTGTIHYFHAGFYEMALIVVQKLKLADFDLNNATFTGHSMGAAVAAICVLLLQQQNISTKAVVFSPPPCMDERSCIFLEQSVTSYVLERDSVPEMSVHAIRTLFTRIQHIKLQNAHPHAEQQQLIANYFEPENTKQLSEQTTLEDDLFVPGRIVISYIGRMHEIERHELGQFTLNFQTIIDHISGKYFMDECCE